MGSVKVKLEGVKAFQKAIDKAAKMTAVKQVVRLNGAEMQRQAMELCPVGTPESTGIPGYKGGTLRRSIQLSFEEEGKTAVVEPTAHYAGYVEYGTRYMENRPFLRPAYFRQRDIFKSDLKKLGLE